MIRQVTVTFNFDPNDEIPVSDLTCWIDGVEKKKKTTRSVKTEVKNEVLENEAIIKLEASKISFNNKAVADMGLKYQDKIIIKYKVINGSKKPLPLIGTDEAFDEEGSGNKLTKTNTLSYRGKANTILSEYGTEFTIEEYSDGIWKLVSTNKKKEPSTYEEVEKEADDLDITILTDNEDDTDEISEMTYIL